MNFGSFKNCSNLVIFAAVIGIVISKMLTNDQQNLIGNFIQTVGANISTIAACGAFAQPSTDTTSTDNNAKNNNDTTNNNNNNSVSNDQTKSSGKS